MIKVNDFFHWGDPDAMGG